ncbi:Leucine-rich repeat receptor protein kinase exs-like protein [Quillaja saponaria]|uniref:Leucine-rich repeat receptor protein kinase exs-like protein n=1 Tax=Quillaja saponaria TaxID=32244 RepID=A0AAD7L3F4_QUISA|nr:Leucine-rich repeat receptor protein kinase exs-like protein [Quillaja saponaria]
MKSPESIDFSGNQLGGEIPKIIYAGNSFLCGDPLPKRCPGDFSRQSPPREGHDEEDEDDEEDKSEKLLFYSVIALGFATGFWTVIGVLFFKKSWRHAYFRCIDETADKIYVAVAVAVKLARLKKRMASKQADQKLLFIFQ